MAIKNGKRASVPANQRDELATIRTNVEDSYKYFRDNVELFHKTKKFVFKTTLSEDDRASLASMDKPELEFNSLEAYVSRLLGEFSTQQPSIVVRGLNDQAVPQLVKFVEGYMRFLLRGANNSQFENRIYKDQLSGGWGVIKVWTEYESKKSFDQVIKVGAHADPTLVGYDPNSREPSKHDGRYCYEFFPKSEEEVKAMAPNLDMSKIRYARSPTGVSWFYRGDNNQKIILVCDYYCKKKKKVTILKLSNGKTVTNDEYKQLMDQFDSQLNVEAPPTIVEKRSAEDDQIVRYRLIGNEIIEYEVTDFSYFPLIFVDGNSVLVRDSEGSPTKQFTRPYVYNAIDTQRLKNFFGISLANEVENLRQAQWLVEKESIPPGQEENWNNPQIMQSLLYNARTNDGLEIPIPQAVMRPPIPPELFAGFVGLDRTMQTSLGSYDAALGINDKQLSGKAIEAGSQNSNSASMPYITNFLAGLDHLAQVILDLLPKYYATPRTLPVIAPDGKRTYIKINDPDTQDPNQAVDMNFDDNVLDVSVDAGVNFDIQKADALQMMTSLMANVPAFAEIINTKGLPIVMENLDIRGGDQLKVLAEEQVEQQEQQAQQGAQQPNPAMVEMQMRQQQMAQKQQEIELNAKNQQTQNEISLQQLQLDREKLLLQAQAQSNSNTVQMVKADTEREVKAADLAMNMDDQTHRHAMDISKHANEMSKTSEETL